MAAKKQQFTYKVILSYTESANPRKMFKIEYTVEGPDRSTALAKAEREFFAYTQYNSASWVRVIDRSQVRVWRLMPDLPQTAQSIDELMARLQEDDADVIYNTLRALGSLEDISASGPVAGFLQHPDHDLAALAAETLGKLGDHDNIVLLRTVFGSRSNPRLRASVIAALGRLARPEDDISDILASALVDGDPRVRANAVEVVELLRLPSSTKILLPLLEDEDNRVRANVLKALWESHDRPRLLSVLRDMTQSDNHWMRASAAFVLQHIDVEGRLELLGKLARDTFPEVHTQALRALKNMDNLECLPYWLEFLDREEDLRTVGQRIANGRFNTLDKLLAFQPRNEQEQLRLRLFLDCVEERIFRDEGWISWLKTKHRRMFQNR